jgi:glycosyltransferase involved in cell wall biosynthesis
MSRAEATGRAADSRSQDGQQGALRIAVLVPCFNEEASIAKVVTDFRAALPEAAIYAYDNNSSDRTAEVARAAGALVRREMHQGKGNVVRRMFSDIDADIYILVDGEPPTTLRARAIWSNASWKSDSTWWWQRASTRSRALTVSAIGPETGR